MQMANDMPSQWFFGKYIQRLLDKKDWNNSDLHERSGLSNTYIGKIIKGKSSHKDEPPSISLDVVLTLANAFGVSEYDLLLAYQGIDPDKAESKPARARKVVTTPAEPVNDERYDRLLKAVSKVLLEMIPDEAARTEKLMELLALPPKL